MCMYECLFPSASAYCLLPLVHGSAEVCPPNRPLEVAPLVDEAAEQQAAKWLYSWNRDAIPYYKYTLGFMLLFCLFVS